MSVLLNAEPPPVGANCSGSTGDGKKTWQELHRSVREVRHRLFKLCTKVPSSFTFRTVEVYGVIKTRLYFLSSPASGRETTLLYVDIPSGLVVEPTNVIPTLAWHSLLESTFKVVPSPSRISKEEQLQWERKRLVTWGITSYDVHEESGLFLFSACSSLFTCVDSGEKESFFPSELKTDCVGARLNSQICPCNEELVAYVSNCDIWVYNTVSDAECRLTFVHKGCKALADDPISAGIPAYVTQEEFNRYSGLWWQPQTQAASGVYRLLYEEVDESDVDILYFTSPDSEDRGVDEYRFPRAGTPNAKSTLKLIQFRLNNRNEFIDIQHFQLQESLSTYFPWLEYIVRVGWMPDGSYVWMQLLNRRQQHLELVLLPLSAFMPVETENSPLHCALGSSISPLVLLTEQSSIWLNVHDILHFFPRENESEIMFIWASEETGFRHLYMITSAVDTPVTNHLGEDSMDLDSVEASLKPRILKKIALTSGEWEVLDKQVWVDEENHLIYFTALMDTPLERHLYVVSWDAPNCIQRLTPLEYSHSVSMDPSLRLFVTVYSSVNRLHASRICSINIPNKFKYVTEITVSSVAHLLYPEALDLKDENLQPELFTCELSSGDSLYGMMFKPPSLIPGKQYPTVLSVYGGPEVQLVTNTFKGVRQLRLHMLAAHGYVVVVVDSRGSRHRGINFESHIKERMGTVEIADQVEALYWLADSTGLIDINRVAIHGWSYGGYLSLMGLAQRPEVFKIAIAGAPVTSWNLYDTGYTERYMDQPANNPSGYRLGSVLSYITNFPNEENRLLIIHGLIDENVHFFHSSQLISALIKAGKPYQLQVYPNERHSLRHLDASEHFEATLLSFLQQWL